MDNSDECLDSNICLLELCQNLEIEMDDIHRLDVSDLPESVTTDSETETVSNDSVLMQPEEKIVNDASKVIFEDGVTLCSSLSDTTIDSVPVSKNCTENLKPVYGDGGCIPFVVQKIIQPRGAPNMSRIKRLLDEGVDLTIQEILNCRKMRKTSYASYCDENGDIIKTRLVDYNKDSYSHIVVHHTLKKNGIRWRKLKNHVALNILMSTSTIVVYGSLNLDFQCEQFPGFVVNEEDNKRQENDHAILVHQGRIKCINLVSGQGKSITLSSRKHMKVERQDQMRSGSYLKTISSAYRLEPRA